MKHRITPENISVLKENEVFLIGTNITGFHGAGAAGHAFRYNNSCNWRYDQFFLKAMKSAPGDPDRIGKWAVFGVANGIMCGTKGMSYGIPTIKKPVLKRSMPLDDINAAVYIFTGFAIKNPHLTFYVPEIGTNLAGYTIDEIAPMFQAAFELENVYLPKRFVEKICTLI